MMESPGIGLQQPAILTFISSIPSMETSHLLEIFLSLRIFFKTNSSFVGFEPVKKFII